MERHRDLGERIITTEDNVASFLPLEIETDFFQERENLTKYFG
jgi:hypothetical protein